MCCSTHNDTQNAAGVNYVLAENDHFRCQCPLRGSPFRESRCIRRATGEDFLCDVCREFHSDDQKRKRLGRMIASDGIMPMVPTQKSRS